MIQLMIRHNVSSVCTQLHDRLPNPPKIVNLNLEMDIFVELNDHD